MNDDDAIPTTNPTQPLPWSEGSYPAPTVAPRVPDVYAPDGSAIRFLLATTHGLAKASVVEVTLPPGQVSRPVRHRTVEEAWYFLSGAGEVWRQSPGDVAGGAIDTVTTGSALAIPVGWAFQFRAGPEAPLRFLCMTMPPWPGPDEAIEVQVGGLGPPTV